MISSNRQRPFLNLNDYLHKLVRHPSDRKAFQCPACIGGKLKFSPTNGTLFSCHGSNSAGCEALDICKALTKGESTFLSDEQKARNEAAVHAQIEKERARKEALKSSEQKNKEFLATLSQRTLSNPHRQDMLDRGYTPEMIKLSGAKSFAAGRGMPVRDYTGKVVGIQRAGKGDKFWLGGDAGNYRLKETDELPLGVVYPPTISKVKKGVGKIGFVEGFDKAWLAAYQLQHPTIGSSNVGTQPKDLARTVAAIQAKYGWKKIELVLYADAGMLSNEGVMGNYTRLHAHAIEIGCDFKVGWWNQYLKLDGDIDEIPDDLDVKQIEWGQFLKIAEDWNTYKELSKLDKKNSIFGELIGESRVNVEEVDQKYIPALKFEPGVFQFVSSLCGTGKTIAIKNLVAEHKATPDTGKVFDITHMNAIKNTHQGLFEIPDWRIGSEESNSGAINRWGAISICLESLLKLDLNSIPRRSLIILDEIEAILTQAAEGNTLGDLAPLLQQHLANIVDRVLLGGGMVVGLEDSLTDITVNAFADITGRNYEYKLLVNNYKSEPWDVILYPAKGAEMMTEILDKLADGQKIALATSSQKMGEKVCRVAAKRIANDERILRIDSKTSADHSDFFADPEKYIKERNLQLTCMSPTIKQGISINLKDEHEVFFGWFTGLSAREQHQMLSRLRQPIPRHLFVAGRGAGAKTLPKNVKKLTKLQQAIATEVKLQFGHGNHQSPMGLIWNRIEAEFSVRSNISATYNAEYLRIDLVSRGHKVTRGVLPAATQEMKDELVREGLLIEQEDSITWANSKTAGLSEQGAAIIIASAQTTHLEKQAARKKLGEARHPGAEVTADFVFKAYIHQNGIYGKQVDFCWGLMNPDVIKGIIGEIIARQKNQPHNINKKAPTAYRKTQLMLPIANDLIELAELAQSGRTYDNQDPVVRRVAAYAVKNSYEFSKFFRFAIKGETIGEDGKTYNSSVATVNKMLKILGYKAKRTSQRRDGKKRIDCYSVTNAGCEVRATIYTALDLKYEAYEPKVIEQEFKPGMSIVTNGELAQVISIEHYISRGEQKTSYKVGTGIGTDDEYFWSVSRDELKRA